jgi:hypothetical protein
MRMRRLSCCLVLVLAAAACGSGRPSAASGSATPASVEIVPWVNRRAPAYTFPAPRQTRLAYAASAPPCHPGQLRATGAVTGAATGNLDERFTFTNVSRSTCLLRGFPTISGVGPSRARRTLHPRRSPSGTFFGQLTPADLLPGRHVLLDLATEDVTCSPMHPPVYRDLRFGLPDGGTLHSGAHLTRVCDGWTMSHFGLPAIAPYIPPRPPGSVSTLRLRMWSPGFTDTRPGATVRFVIMLSNPTHTTIRLDRCPSYTLGIYAIGFARRRSYFLNCDTVTAIRQGQHVRYRMRLAIPASRRLHGVAKFAWQLDTPASLTAARTLEVG